MNATSIVRRTALSGFVGAMLLLGSVALPARALPGQTTAQFLGWAKSIPNLGATLQKETDELSGWPAYHVLKGDHGVTWDFRALTDGKGTIREERFMMASGPGEVGSEPINQDGSGYGFTFFAATMGKAVADDFRHAKLVAPFSNSKDPKATRFYRGARYGWEDDGGRMVHLFTFRWFATQIATVERCAKNPNGCSE
jgi:hypothetical protein